MNRFLELFFGEACLLLLDKGETFFQLDYATFHKWYMHDSPPFMASLAHFQRIYQIF